MLTTVKRGQKKNRRETSAESKIVCVWHILSFYLIFAFLKMINRLGSPQLRLSDEAEKALDDCNF